MWGFFQSNKSETAPTFGPEGESNPDSMDVVENIQEMETGPEPEDTLADIRPLPSVQLNDTLHDIVKK